jgi:hypothetical protein
LTLLPRTQAIDEKTLELLRLSTPTDLYELLSFPISYDAAYGEAELAKQLAAISGGCRLAGICGGYRMTAISGDAVQQH